ncbi:MAG: acyltransferase, partial [Pseudomonadota bacterium]
PGHWGLNSMAGPMGMSLFFCLSGFLIVSILNHNPDVPSFLIKRVLRIVPAVILYMCILVLLFGIPWQMFAANALFVSNYWHVGLSKTIAPTSHLWSLAVEMHFYIAIALTTLLLGRRAFWLIPPAALAVTLMRIDVGAYTNIKTHLRVDEILAGGMLAMVAIHWGDRMRRVFAGTWRPALALAVLTPLWMLGSHDAGGALNYARPYLAAALVGVVLFGRLPALHPILEGRIAAYIAKISYALYIYHPLMIFAWMNAGSDWVRYLVKRPISYALTWAAAHASTYFWEARWQSFARSWVKRRTLAVAG